MHEFYGQVSHFRPRRQSNPNHPEGRGRHLPEQPRVQQRLEPQQAVLRLLLQRRRALRQQLGCAPEEAGLLFSVWSAEFCWNPKVNHQMVGHPDPPPQDAPQDTLMR